MSDMLVRSPDDTVDARTFDAKKRGAHRQVCADTHQTSRHVFMVFDEFPFWWIYEYFMLQSMPLQPASHTTQPTHINLLLFRLAQKLRWMAHSVISAANGWRKQRHVIRHSVDAMNRHRRQNLPLRILF